MKPTNLPITLLNERAKFAKSHLLDVESYSSVFGPKKTRKRPNLKINEIGDLVKEVDQKNETYSTDNDVNIVKDDGGVKEMVKDWVMGAGQSKRIWNELYKVIDSSDVLIQVLDARDPIGTRSPYMGELLVFKITFRIFLNHCF